jgi:hypothetical protein
VADPSETTQISRPPAPDEPTGSTQSSEVLGALRELSAQVGNLRSEVQTLRATSRSLPDGAEPAGWDDPRRGASDTLTWVRALDAPSQRMPAVPRLLLEIVFLVAVAVGAEIADLDAAEVVVVMGGAWAIVALAEWSGARAARRRAEAVYQPLPGFAPGYPTDPSWFAPPVERTVLDVVEAGDDTEAKLPPPTD